MSPLAKPTKVLHLTIEVPGLWADDLDESAQVQMDMDPGEWPAADARLVVVTEEWMEEEVVLVLQTIPQGDGEEKTLQHYRCRIVAAEAAPLRPSTTEQESDE